MPAKTVIQVRRDTAANWASTSPSAKALAPGEIGFETDTGKFKIGPGTSPTNWNSITTYANADDFIMSVASGSAITVTDGAVNVAGVTQYVTGTTTETFVRYPKVTVKAGATAPTPAAVGDVWIKF
jgi:hypothetical protein